jgi:hypothetical protein
VELNKNNSLHVLFTISDTPGRYLINLTQINLKGESFKQVSEVTGFKEYRQMKDVFDMTGSKKCIILSGNKLILIL